MKRTWKGIAISLAAVCVLSACGPAAAPAASGEQTAAAAVPQGGAAGAAANPSAKVFKISNNQQPTHPVNVALEQFKKNVEERTGGSVVIDLYPSGSLADDVTALDQVALGTIQGAVIMNSPNILVVGTDNGLGYIEELPFLFSDAQTARKAYDGGLGQAFKDMTAEYGITTINFWENGFRNMTNNERPIVTPADMKGIKFRIANSDIRQQTFETLGASAIPMAFSELFTGLQQGTVQGQENPLAIIQTSRFYEVQKYLSLSHHIYNTATFIVHPASFEALSEEEQKIFREEADAARDMMRQLNDEFEASAVDFLKEQGMEVNEIDTQSFIDAVQPVWKSFEEKYGRELIDIALSAGE